jgi:hypothetical protein
VKRGGGMVLGGKGGGLSRLIEHGMATGPRCREGGKRGGKRGARAATKAGAAPSHLSRACPSPRLSPMEVPKHAL